MMWCGEKEQVNPSGCEFCSGSRFDLLSGDARVLTRPRSDPQPSQPGAYTAFVRSRCDTKVSLTDPHAL